MDVQAKIENRLQILLKVGLVTLFLLSLALIYFLTLSFDEAWLLSHYQEIFEGERFQYKLIPYAMTNGGVFVMGGTLLYSLFGSQVWMYRLISYFSVVIISCILWRWSRRRWSDTSASLIVLSVFLGMWGTVELSSLAYACVLAMMFLLIGLNFLMSADEKNSLIRSCLFAGLFIGFASSARLNLLAIFPALFLEAILPPGNRKKKMIEACYISLFGTMSFILSQLIVVFITPVPLGELVEYSISFTGFGTLWLDYPRILNKWIVANGFLPIFMMIGVTAYAFLDSSKYSRAMRLLVVFGWLHWFAWLTRAPIAHLRYLWPTIAAFGIVGGFGLASFYVWAKENSRQALCCAAMVVALGFSAQGFVNGFRSLIHGESNILSWEWSRETPLSNYRWIRYQPDQKKMSEYLTNHVKEGEKVGVLGLDLELELLSGVKIVPLRYYFEKNIWNENPLPKRLLITPMIGVYLYLDPSISQWMKENLHKEVQFGRYILYQVEGRYPEKPDMFRHYHTPHPNYPHSDPFF